MLAGVKLWKTWLYVSDADTLLRLQAFYSDVMGFGIVDDQPHESVWFDVGDGNQLGFHVGERIDNPGAVNLSFLSDDVDAEVERLRDRGVDIKVGPADMSWGDRAAAFYDPAGHSVWIQRPLQT